MADADSPAVLDLDVPAAEPSRERRRPARRPARPPTRRHAHRRRVGAALAVAAVLAAGAVGQQVSERSGHHTAPVATAEVPVVGEPTDTGGVRARDQQAFDSVHVDARTDTALAEFATCTAAVGVRAGDPAALEQDHPGGRGLSAAQASTTALCRSAYLITVRAIYADLARAVSRTGTAGAAPPP